MKAAGVDFAAIPGELKLLKRWVVWRYERRGDKRTKVPYSVNDVKASVTEPDHWREFDAVAEEFIRRSDRYQGIGFVVTPPDELTVWDFDHVIDPKTVQITDPEVTWAMGELNSYTEITPSGEGLRIITHGKLPKGRNRNGKFEGYSEKRYVTLTGNRFPGTPSHVEPRQTAIERVFRRLLLQQEDALEAALRDPAVAALFKAGSEEAREQLGFSSQSEADLALCRLLLRYGTVGEVEEWFRKSALYRPKWDRGDYRKRTLEKAQELHEKEEGARLTDRGNSIRFTDLAEGKHRYVREYGDWVSWVGNRFEYGRLDLVEGLGDKVVEELFKQAVGIKGDDDERKRWFKHALNLEGRSHFEAMIAMSRGRCFVRPRDLDADRAFLNLPSGTLELPSDPKVPVIHREHRMADLITKIGGVRYDAEARCPKWLEFVNLITCGRADLARYLQALAGYSLSGYAGEQKLFYLYGTGANGKTTFVRTMMGILGEYASTLETSTLLLNKQDPHPTGLADLQGLNLAVVSELPEGRRLNEDLIKRVTGGELIKARRMHRDFFSFENHAKLWIYGNYKLRVGGVEHAIWRRMTMIPFDANIRDEEAVKDYWNVLLEEEGSGILNWCLEGFTRWREEGLTIPGEIATATEEYRAAEDLLGQFISERLEVGSHLHVYTEDVFRAWNVWCEGRGEKPGTSRMLTDRLRARGIPTTKGTANKVRFMGFAIRTDREEM